MQRIRQYLGINELNNKGYTGKNVGIAVLDTGVSKHPDIYNRIICFQDFVNQKERMYDDNGHGTHVTGILSGSGKMSNSKYMGVAPDSKIIMIKCLNQSGNGKAANALKGFDFIINNKEKYHIRIVNISVGATLKLNDKENDQLIEGVEELWNHGLVVVVAAGNNGPRGGTITVPGCAKSVITVGASDDNAETKNGTGYMKNYSGRGPTNICVVKPEIVCPGTNIISCDAGLTGYSPKSGTSMATPVVSGIIALLLEKYPDMTNKEIKRKLYETAKDLGYPKNHQGWGEISPIALIK